MLARFYSNHVLANLTFVVVLVMGYLAYNMLPREQDPTINFNWIDITTVMPGAAAEDIEKRITNVLEDAIRTVSDIKFVSSSSREGLSNILVRFEELDERTFDKRLTDLRREIQNKERELPPEAESPFVFEVTTANAFPTATVVVTGPADDENLRRQAELVKKDLERIKGVDKILATALHEPELQVKFSPQRLQDIGLSPTQLADTVALYYRDISAGSLQINDQNWLVRVVGKSAEADALAALPLFGNDQELRLRDVASIERSREKPQHLVSYEFQPAVKFGITKKAYSNTLDLVERINTYVEQRRELRVATGVDVVLVDDQTEITRNALNIMQTNALLGLLMVLLVAWIFLGIHIALLTAIGIPFILAGTFWLLSNIGQTLNVSVLLGVVISLGMLVDDAVVMVEAIYYRLQRGIDSATAAVESIKEVFGPITAAVLTTIAAFLPLMLLPGILGQYMLVIPLVVTVALAISLVEAYWMLPAHIMAANIHFQKPSFIQRQRTRFLHFVRVKYTRLLVGAMRHPIKLLVLVVSLFIASLFSAFAGQVNPQLQQDPQINRFLVKTDFFAFDPLRLFYINIEMPNGTPLEKTLEKTLEVERKIRQHILPEEMRSVVSYAGEMITETAPFQGNHYGQILVTLQPKTEALREVSLVIESMREDVVNTSGPLKIVFLKISGGPPVSKPVNVKVRGDNIEQIRAAVNDLKAFLEEKPEYFDIDDDDSPGLREMSLSLKHDAIVRNQLNPSNVARNVGLLVDGEIITTLQDQGEEVTVRVKAATQALPDGIYSLLDQHIPNAQGELIPLRELVTVTTQIGNSNIRHYNFLRTVSVESDIDKSALDTVRANALIAEHWEQALQQKYPTVNLDFSGELDDIQESLDAIGVLFLFGVGLMYLILGTQFKSYFQPFMILATVPMAFIGVVIGLLVTQNPLSLYTMYGVVALAGIAVNAAIVLISAANSRLKAGMSVLHATIYAARRRVIPILITSLTTIAGLFSLATGLGGHSLLWGPVATAIVWGLVFSTALTLFVVPTLYRIFMRGQNKTPGIISAD